MNFLQQDGTWRHIGITSFVSSAGCDSTNAFTRTRYYMDWIMCVIETDDPADNCFNTTNGFTTPLSTLSTGTPQYNSDYITTYELNDLF